MYNPQLASWRTSPAGNEIERHTLGWLSAKFGLPARHTCKLYKRRFRGEPFGGNRRLDTSFSRLWRRRSSLPRCDTRDLSDRRGTPLIQQDRAHDGARKESSAHGSDDLDLKMDLEDLGKRVAEDRKNGFAPFMVIGTAGTTTAGVIDPLRGLGRFCQDEDLWFHVDAAGAARRYFTDSAASPLRNRSCGFDHVRRAQMVLRSMGSGMFFCRHPDTLPRPSGRKPRTCPGKLWDRP